MSGSEANVTSEELDILISGYNRLDELISDYCDARRLAGDTHWPRYPDWEIEDGVITLYEDQGDHEQFGTITKDELLATDMQHVRDVIAAKEAAAEAERKAFLAELKVRRRSRDLQDLARLKKEYPNA